MLNAVSAAPARHAGPIPHAMGSGIRPYGVSLRATAGQDTVTVTHRSLQTPLAALAHSPSDVARAGNPEYRPSWH